MTKSLTSIAAITAGLLVVPAAAQDGSETVTLDPQIEEDDSVFDETWVGVGIGVRLDTSYDGSDDYVVYPLPAVTGRIKGVEFSPRSAGLALTVYETNLTDDIEFGIGPVGRLRQNRTGNIQDPVVEAAGRLDTAVELGVSMGVTFKRVLNPYDRLSVGGDIRWDVAGAHSGMIIDPGVSYRTPLSRGSIASVSVGALYANGDFNDYYFSVSPQQSIDSGLPVFTADSGWYKAGGSLAFGFDLDGDLENGGFVVGATGGYSRMLGDAAATPYTRIRGDKDQYYAATGIGYIF